MKTLRIYKLFVMVIKYFQQENIASTNVNHLYLTMI